MKQPSSPSEVSPPPLPKYSILTSSREASIVFLMSITGRVVVELPCDMVVKIWTERGECDQTEQLVLLMEEVSSVEPRRAGPMIAKELLDNDSTEERESEALSVKISLNVNSGFPRSRVHRSITWMDTRK